MVIFYELLAAYVLNLRGQDIPHNPLFHAYLYIGLQRVVLFADGVKIHEDVADYLQKIGVERKEYNDLWTFLRRREWGEGKVTVTMKFPSYQDLICLLDSYLATDLLCHLLDAHALPIHRLSIVSG